MPTLLSINNYYYFRGGAETVFLEQNRTFKDDGWTVVPFSMHHRHNLDAPWSKYFVEGIEFGERYSAWQKLTRIPKVIYSFEARRQLASLMEEVKPNIAHVHNIYHHISPSILSLLKSRGVPVVLTVHDLKLACPAYAMFSHDGICERCNYGRLYNVLVHRCIKRSLSLSGIVLLESILHRLLGSYRCNVDRFVVPSRFYLEKLIEWGWERGRFRYVPNFVDVNTHRPDGRVGKAFIYFGRLGSEKGLATLVMAAALAKVEVWIAGAGPEKGFLTRLAEKVGANVTFLGYLRGESLRSAIASARAAVLPSEWYENAPMSVMESYALGRPVIGAAIGGIPELVREEETGITFKSGSVEDLAAALRKLADMSERTVTMMGQCGRVWMESDFSIEKYRERISAIYGELDVSRSVDE